MLTPLLQTTKDPSRDNVKFHGDGESQVMRYRFNTKEKDQMFCGKCGASLGIDFRDFYMPKWTGYGISVSLLPEGWGLREWGSRGEESERVCVTECMQDGIG